MQKSAGSKGLLLKGHLNPFDPLRLLKRIVGFQGQNWGCFSSLFIYHIYLNIRQPLND